MSLVRLGRFHLLSLHVSAPNKQAPSAEFPKPNPAKQWYKSLSAPNSPCSCIPSSQALAPASPAMLTDHCYIGSSMGPALSRERPFLPSDVMRA